MVIYMCDKIHIKGEWNGSSLSEDNLFVEPYLNFKCQIWFCDGDVLQKDCDNIYIFQSFKQEINYQNS